MKLLRVVHANQLCDIVQAVNADELKHSWLQEGVRLRKCILEIS